MKTAQKAITVVQREPHLLTRILLNAPRYWFLKRIMGKAYGTQKVHGSVMKLNLQDKGISRTLFLLQDREKEHRHLLKKIIKPNHRVLDLGANIGYYVLLESKILSNSGEIIAIEPHPDNFELLKDNVELNRLPNIHLIHAAVAEQDGTATLHLSKLSNVHSLLKDTLSNSAEKSIEVPARSIKSLIDEFGSIDVIRMDIEGYEQSIFSSLIQLQTILKSNLPTILFELHTKKYNWPIFEKTMADLHAMGYKVSYLANSNKKAIRDSGASISLSIPTDGTIRHIIANPTPEQVKELLPSSRCAVLTAQSS